MEKLLVIEDAENTRALLAEELGKEYLILQGADFARAMDQFQRFAPKVVTLNLNVAPDEGEDASGFSCLQRMLARHPETKVVAVVENGDRELAHRALRCGAYDCYQKPIEVAELRLVIRRAFHLSGLEEEQRRLKDALERRGQGLAGLVGQCPAMQRVFSALRMVAASDVPVLIAGESGTGKELLARTVRSLGARADGPFLPMKCDAVAGELLEGELFGWGPGAHGEATNPGKIEQGGKGTLYLDEPAGLPHNLQLRLLRVLEQSEQPGMAGTGDAEHRPRVICASATRPLHAVRAGVLLEELYHRISVVTLELPPLRERGEDILLLAQLFLRRFVQACHGNARGFTPAAISALKSHPWPGNVRELEGRVQRGVIMSEGPLLEPSALGFCGSEAVWVNPVAARTQSLREARDQVERKVISAAITASRGNLLRASELLEVSRSTLYDLLKKHGLFSPGTRH